LKMNSVTVAKPKSILQKKIKVDFKPLFLAIGKAVAHTATLKFDELGVDALQIATSVGIETTMSELAFELIQRSLFGALYDLSKESLSHISKDITCFDKLSAEIETQLTGLELKFDKDFFKRPSKLPLLKEIEVAYSQWLCDVGVAPGKANLIAQRIRSYFVFALASEWKQNSKKYQPLLDANSSPFLGAEEYERGWNSYFAALDRRIAENVFDEPFCLEQIYVPLNAYYVEKSKERTQEVHAQSFQAKKAQVVVALEDELRSWLKKGDATDAIRVISGGPGSGKSSFTKILCSKLASESVAKPIYIPLHLIDPTREVAVEVERFVRDEGLLGFNPLDADRKEEKLLLVFDGLDELASQGKAAVQVTRDFVQAVERMVDRRNLGQYPIFVVMSGREVVVQENETEFRKPHQILSLLPYFTPVSERRQFIDTNKLLEVDYRDNWWAKYGTLTGENYQGLPDELKSREIDEITSQPLLNYLVALSFTRGKLDFSAQLNLNSVYADLVAAVHERGYEKSRTFKPIRHITADDFLRVLEEIGLAAWHGSDGRSTSVKDIMEHCRRGGLETLLNTFKEGAEAGITKLLAAFFFRRNGETAGEDAAFVFTHKSFGEYLTAARLTRGIERINVGRKRHLKDPDDGIDIADALMQWARLTGPASMSSYIQTFLKREIARRNISQVLEWHETLSELVEASMDRHLPIDRLEAATFLKMFRLDANGTCSLLIALNACAIVVNKSTKIKFESESSFGTYLRRICPQRIGPINPPLYSALSYLDLSGQCLDMSDFYGANIQFTIWKKAKVHFANFDLAKINAVDFTEARLSWSRFNSNELIDTKFENADLSEVSFQDANFNRCTFDRARLKLADFNRAEILNCSFLGAEIALTNIHECRNIKACNFDGAIIYANEIEVLAWFDEQKKLGNVVGDLKIENPNDSKNLNRKVKRLKR
jgi:uncharacterized protein YjbI with pentapeptide repeats